jgi:hypothetical protein
MARLSGVHTMMRVITEVFKMPSGSIIPLLYVVKEDGQVDQAITNTLCDFVSHLFPPADAEFEELLVKVEASEYVPGDASLADFGVNDINVWLVAPHTPENGISISNENTSEYSIDDGLPQQFSIREFRLVSDHWKKFQQIIRKNGIENLAGQKFEALIL